MKRVWIFLFVFILLVVVFCGFFYVFEFTGFSVKGEESFSVTKTYIHAGALLASKTSGSEKIDFYIQDHLGSNRKIYKSDSGEISLQEKNTYYDFGETFSTPTSENDYKYTGKELDSETGLYYYGARYYKPEVGRFMQADVLKGSVEDPLSLNRYAYVKNNPLKYIDPSGNAVGLDQLSSEQQEKFVQKLNNLVGEGVFGLQKDKKGNVMLSVNNENYKGTKDQNKIFELVKSLVDFGGFVFQVKMGEKDASTSKGELLLSSLEEGKVSPYGENGEDWTSVVEGSIVHEFQHLYDAKDLFGGDEVSYSDFASSRSEENAVNTENAALRILGLPERKYYSGFDILHIDSDTSYVETVLTTSEDWDEFMFSKTKIITTPLQRVVGLPPDN